MIDFPVILKINVKFPRNYSLYINMFLYYQKLKNKTEMGIFKHVMDAIIKEVAKKNQANENVKTADPVVFEELEKKLSTIESSTPESSSNPRADAYKDYFEKIQEAQRENEASQEVETADASVYTEMMAEIERLKSKVESQNAGQAPDLDFNTSAVGSQAMTNSMGGSLQLRAEPQMGAQKINVFVPDMTLLKVIQYSDHSINLDGRDSRFVLVEHNGQKGWVLENYLNFN